MVDGNQSLFNESRALRLFPTLVWKADLKHEIFQAINERILVRLVEMRRSLPQLRPGQAWQSDQELHQLVEFRDLLSCVNEVAENVLGHLKRPRKLPRPRR